MKQLVTEANKSNFIEQDNFDQAAENLRNIEIDFEQSQEEENSEISALLPFIMPVVSTVIYSLTTFRNQIDKFIKDGPTVENNGAELIAKIVKAFYQEKADFGFLGNLIPTQFKDYYDVIQQIVAPEIQEVMMQSLLQLLTSHKQDLTDEQVLAELKAIETKDSKVELDDLKHGKVLVQIYLNDSHGKCSIKPITFLVNKTEVENIIAEHKDKAGFIKVLSDGLLTHEFFPPRQELINGLQEAAKNNDQGLLALCIHNKKLPIEIFNGIFAKGRFDVLNEMIENKHFGFGKEEIAHVDEKDIDGLTELMKACRDGDELKAKKLLAMGANPCITDKDGNNALMHAVSYSNKNIDELNKPSGLHSTQMNQLQQSKNAIVKALLNNKRLNLDAQNNQKQTALQIAITQGMTKDDKNISELRGDHGIIEQLISSGCNPVFGEFELSYKAKTLMTLGLSIGLTFAKNQLLNYVGIGFFGRFMFYPIIKVLDIALDSVIFYKGYLDAKNPLYKACRTFLDTEYANDTLINLEKKILIGAYHINWFGKIISGEELKSYMSNHIGYRNTNQGYFSLNDVPTTSSEAPEFKMSKRDQLEMAQILFNRYYRIQENLKNHWMAPWTREALENLAKEIASVYEKTKFSYEINNDFNEKIKATFTESNHAALVNEIYASKENRALFYKIHSAIKSGALFADLDTKYNLEKFEQKLHNPELLKKSFLEQAADYSNNKKLSTSPVTFAEFANFCNSLKSNDIDFEGSLEVILDEFNTDLANDRIQKSYFERIKDATGAFARNTMDKVVDGVAYVGGYERRDVYDGIADVLSTVGATGNAAGHVAFREFYDSSYFLPSIATVGCAYALYRWPQQTWAAAKFCFSALSNICSLIYQALVITASAVCATFHYSALVVNQFCEYINQFTHSVKTHEKSQNLEDEGKATQSNILGEFTARIKLRANDTELAQAAAAA